MINPTIRGKKGNVENSFIELKNSTKATNVIEGMPRRKENVAASSLSQPNNNAKEIVAPDLDIPGIIAKD